MTIGARIYFDLDGVLRDLCAGISNHRGYPYDPQSWNEYCGRGLTLCEYIDLHKSILLDAPATEYLSTIVEMVQSPEILTCQPLPWIPYTRFWIERNIPGATVRWCCCPEEKLDILERENAVIVEDYPFFKDNSRIIMIDRPYNRHVEGCYARVTTPKALLGIIGGSTGAKQGSCKAVQKETFSTGPLRTLPHADTGRKAPLPPSSCGKCRPEFTQKQGIKETLQGSPKVHEVFDAIGPGC